MMRDERAVNCLFGKLQSPGGVFFFFRCGRIVEGRERKVEEGRCHHGGLAV